MSTADETTTGLVPWVRTLSAEDTAALLDVARPGQTLDEWMQAAEDELHQAVPDYRKILLATTRRLILDHDGEHIVDSRFLRLFQQGSPRRRTDLFYARYGLAHPWTSTALREVVLPELLEAERPLAPHDAGWIPTEQWGTFVDQQIDPSRGASSRRKTRSCVVGILTNLGCLEPRDKNRGPTRVRRGNPDPLAFGWVLERQLQAEGRVEAMDDWACTQSEAARLWALTPDVAARCLEACVAQGLLERSYLAGMPRIRRQNGEG